MPVLTVLTFQWRETMTKFLYTINVIDCLLCAKCCARAIAVTQTKISAFTELHTSGDMADNKLRKLYSMLYNKS